jgi:hypothetical protein
MALFGDGVNITKTTSATAGTYGSATTSATITVDANQRISGITNTTITAAVNANAAAGDVGTYGFMQQATGNTTYNPGDTLAGSSLRYSDATGRLYTTTSPSGNWRCMGYDSGAALVNTGTGTGTGTGSGTISGTTSVSGTVTVPGKSATAFTATGTTSGTATINTVTVNSVTVNTTVAYSSTLWLRYS